MSDMQVDRTVHTRAGNRGQIMKLKTSRRRRPPYADLPIFSGWSKKEFELLGRLAEQVEYDPGEFITTSGPMAREFLIITCGRAKVLSGREGSQSLGPGDTVGEQAMLAGPVTSTIAAVAETYLEALLLGPKEFDCMLTEVPSLVRHISHRGDDHLHHVANHNRGARPASLVLSPPSFHRPR